MSEQHIEQLIERGQQWLAHEPETEYRELIQQWIQSRDVAALSKAFAARLGFGTAGIRGELGAGPGHMNRALIRIVSAGLAEYLSVTVENAKTRGIVVGHDARRGSVEFAADAVAVFAAQGFKVHIMQPLAPTPLVAYATLHLNAACGVVVTASHNPPAYNGYKVYWENGAQIVPPHDIGIAAAIDSVNPAEIIMDTNGGEYVPESLIGEYLHALAEQVPVLPVAMDPAKAVAYTPLHGVGGDLCERVLQAEGLEVHTVASQAVPDGSFPTVDFPNPEEPGAMDAVVALAQEVGAPVALANDPDADRLALVLTDASLPRPLTGDEIGAVMAEVLLSRRTPEDHRQRRSFVGRTIVSAELIDRVAAAHGADCMVTLTGFKWLWNTALNWMAEGRQYVMAYEEAIGFSVGPAVRDKDGIGAAVLAARILRSPRSFRDRLEGLWNTHGVLATRQMSIVDGAPGGIDRHKARMAALRENSPCALLGQSVVRVHDYAAVTDGPKTNCLAFWLDDGTRVMLRPSGTGPKLKSYFQVEAPLADGVHRHLEDRLDSLSQEMTEFLLAL